MRGKVTYFWLRFQFATIFICCFCLGMLRYELIFTAFCSLIPGSNWKNTTSPPHSCPEPQKDYFLSCSRNCCLFSLKTGLSCLKRTNKKKTPKNKPRIMQELSELGPCLVYFGKGKRKKEALRKHQASVQCLQRGWARQPTVLPSNLTHSLILWYGLGIITAPVCNRSG